MSKQVSGIGEEVGIIPNRNQRLHNLDKKPHHHKLKRRKREENKKSETMAAEKPVMLVGVDESEHSFYALQWTLDRFFAPYPQEKQPFKLILVHSKSSPTTVIGLAGPGAAEVLPFVEMDLKRATSRVIDKSKEITSKAVSDVQVDVAEGDPRNVLCDAVDKHHATILVVGSHGYGTWKRAVLGSVSDYCAHHAHCNVMIVKRPKVKN